MFDTLRKMGNGFRKPKKLTNAQLERQQKAKEFGEKYEALCTELGLQLIPVIKRETNGAQYPDLVLGEYQPPKLKNWGEAQAENLEVQKKCRHLNENGENCKTCGVRIADQHESGTGVTEEFIKVKLQKIADFKAKEAEHNKDEAVH